MSIGDVNRGGVGSPGSTGRVSLWSIGLTALLVATGFAHRPFTSPASTSTGGGAPREEDRRRRSASGPPALPTRGWKDLPLGVCAGVTGDRSLALPAAVTC